MPPQLNSFLIIIIIIITVRRQCDDPRLKTADPKGYHFSGISGNLVVSGNSAKVGEKSGNAQGICVIKEI